MDTILFGFFLAAYVGLFLYITAAYKKFKVNSSAILIPVVLGLVYDNTIISTGKFIGEGTLLENLNLVRYWLHAFFTPLLVLFAWKTLEQAHIGWADTKWFTISGILVTIGLVILELVTEVFGLVVSPEWEYGVLTYSSTDASGGPPIMVLIVSLILFISSIIIWRKQKWVWFFIGSAAMIAGSAVPLPVESAAVTNFFELGLLISLAATAVFQGKNK
ncbi:hypothetical protein D3H55_20820 [Bacillus salacetis]|uniref:Phospholipid phosphatase n=1 Tax=Bacillus salacetis TaxID=2315464 RepID=A0A3A1QQH8_9BACI|nr:hypothetical protein [Bacillus salacetis]RIW28744.1 hypothetical protein D3H55_20820 [Bacillus salacetis]